LLEVIVIKCRLSSLLGDRKLKIADVARDTGINRGTLTRLYHETAERIELDVLDKLCEYFGCEVQDLLRYEPRTSAQ
jgi:putative transcriptional regulator